MSLLKVFIGFDQHESIAYNVLAHSIQRRASKPVAIIPLRLEQLGHIFTRPRSPDQSTDFTYTRFLTPYLAGSEGISIFLDCDMLCRCDIYELETFVKADWYNDVCVVKHDYTPNPAKKFLNQKQTIYPCKNWSSLMVFNGHRTPVKRLTPEYINTAPAMDLHQFKWAQNVGELPKEYNHLVGEEGYSGHNAKIVHYTRGGPWFKGFEHCDYSTHWFAEFEDMCACKNYNSFKRKTV
jgi:hypothetical protein